uniref:Peptidase S33 tripeptidyl aminopeptidase-like C-terminal domain-containing protein n=1 Tax=Schizophyllum commune (strain H4-8 / FGSC 9210) TaxID=578458 RepID=D8Q7J3_SCHCM
MFAAASAVLLGACALAVGAADATATKRGSEVEWSSCSDLNPLYSFADATNITCGFYEVPLDYADESAGTAKLALAKDPAPEERWGTMFVNPGGPGISGVGFLLMNGTQLRAAVGNHYDIVAWDPRGSQGNTVPGAISCFSSADEYNEFFNGTLEATGIEIHGNLTDDDQVEQFYSHIDEMDAKYRELAERCVKADADGKILRYVGTVATARDIATLADYLDPGVQEVNYWVFPERVGHVVLDGCMNPEIYWTEPSIHVGLLQIRLYYPNNMLNTDETFTGFADACAQAGKGSCPLAQNDTSTGADVVQYVRDLFDRAHNLLESGADMSQTLTSSEAREWLWSTLYLPPQWSSVADTLSAWAQSLDSLSSNSTVPSDVAAKLVPLKYNITAPPVFGTESIYCGDAIDAGNQTMRDSFEGIANASRDVSPIFGPRWHVIPAKLCYAWPARAVERFTGPWDSKPKNTVLIIGNKVDPITPYSNSQRVASILGDKAVLVTQNGFGHTSLAEKSTCTINAIKQYFADGSLPTGDDTQCEIDDDVVIFPKSDGTQVSAQPTVGTDKRCIEDDL